MANIDKQFYEFVNNNRELLGLDLNTTYSKPVVGSDSIYLARLYLGYTAGRLDESKTLD